IDETGLYGGHDVLVIAYVNLNQFKEARAVIEEAKTKKILSPHLVGVGLYMLAFFQKDTAGVEQQGRFAGGKHGAGGGLLNLEAHSADYAGRLKDFQEFFQQAVTAAEGRGDKEMKALFEASAALMQAQFGLMNDARQRATAALRTSASRDVQYGAALALATAGEGARAQSLADDLGKRFPEDTIVQYNYLPTLPAQLADNRNDAPRAVLALQSASPYELRNVDWSSLYPVYVRGLAYLTEHRGSEAMAEFQKILDHRGIVLNECIGALAHLQLG